jgi:hypothetical protein
MPTPADRKIHLGATGSSEEVKFNADNSLAGKGQTIRIFQPHFHPMDQSDSFFGFWHQFCVLQQASSMALF